MTERSHLKSKKVFNEIKIKNNKLLNNKLLSGHRVFKKRFFIFYFFIFAYLYLRNLRWNRIYQEHPCLGFGSMLTHYYLVEPWTISRLFTQGKLKERLDLDFYAGGKRKLSRSPRRKTIWFSRKAANCSIPARVVTVGSQAGVNLKGN